MRVVLLLLVLGACAAPRSPVRTLEDIFEPPPDRAPFRFRFSPDGSRLAYLRPRAGSRLADLWVRDVQPIGKERLVLSADATEQLTAAQKAARERRRDRTRGVGSFRWRPDGKAVLIARSGDLFELALGTGKLTRLTNTRKAERNARWSPDGKALAFVRDRDLYIRRGAKETRLTQAKDTQCGLAEFIAAEELGRHEGFWWSPHARHIAYVEYDERAVPEFSWHDYLPVRGKTVSRKYPRAGDANVKWTLWVGNTNQKGKRTAMSVTPGNAEYLVRVQWTPDGALAVQTANRAQTELTLWRCDPATGKAQKLLIERDDAWVRFHRDLHFLPDGRFTWTSEASGWNRLYLVSADGKTRRALTDDGWEVARVHHAQPGRILFTGSRKNPRERHLYSVDLKTGAVENRGGMNGWHSVVVAPDGRSFVTTHSSGSAGSTAHLIPIDGLGATNLGGAKWADGPGAEFLTVPADDGTPLPAMLIRPEGRPRAGLVFCYGGPGAHLIADRWGGSRFLWHRRLAQRGYAVLTVDNRGSGGYGRDYCRKVAGQLCDYEVRDQAAAARWLKKKFGIDRVGIWGWSYGGTLSLMCVQERPDAFACAIAVAPVTDWRDYDTAYTERYLGLPKQRPDAYAAASPITRAHKLKRPVFLAHGMADDNVHFRGAMAYLHKAQKAGVTIDQDFWPKGAHGIGDWRARVVLFRKIESFLDMHIAKTR